jgi:hypothetical protein
MSEQQSKRFGIFLLGIFLVSLSVLCFEVALSFEFAFIFWFYLSFIVIAVAMFGIGVGSVIGYFLRKRNPSSYFSLLHYSAIGAGGGMMLSLFVTSLLSKTLFFPEFSAQYIIEFLIPLFLILGAAVIPFIFSGIFLSVSLDFPSEEKRNISYIYFADLVGAGLGAFLITALLPFSNVEGVIALCSLIIITASLIFIEKKDFIRIGTSILFLIIAIGVFANINAFNPEPMGGKFLTSAKENGACIIDTRWTSVSRVDVIEYEDRGLKRFVENGEYPITISDGNYLSQHKGSDPRWTMFYKKPKSMLAIGSGGGVELTMALQEGVEKITAVEINPFIVEYMKNEMAHYSNNLYFNQKITTEIEDGRTFIHRSNERYDLIENGVIGSAGLVVPSTSMLTTKDVNVYTVEANQEYIRHLSDDGVAVTIIYGLLDDFNTIDRERGITSMVLKQFTTVREALLREGLDPSKHFLIFRYLQGAGNFQDSTAQAEYTFIFKSELSKAEVLELISVAEKYNLEILHAPFYEDAIDLDAFISDLPKNKDVSPATDDRPFFYFTDRSIGTLLLIAIAFLVIITLIFIILPIALHQSMNVSRSNAAMLLFFLSIGIGYILIEATLIQKLVLFLGRPSYSFQVVLFSMLFFSGLGSLTTGAMIKREESISGFLILLLLSISLALFLYSGLIQTFIFKFIHLDSAFKILLTVGLLAPLSFIMGMPFPMGLRLVSQKNPENVIWMYGVNSSGSVLASIIGMFVALVYGFTTALFLGVIMYLIALATLIVNRRLGG